MRRKAVSRCRMGQNASLELQFRVAQAEGYSMVVLVWEAMHYYIKHNYLNSFVCIYAEPVLQPVKSAQTRNRKNTTYYQHLSGQPTDTTSQVSTVIKHLV